MNTTFILLQKKKNQRKRAKAQISKTKNTNAIFWRRREKRKKCPLTMTVVLLTRGKKVIVEWLLGLLWWFDVAI